MALSLVRWTTWHCACVLCSCINSVQSWPSQVASLEEEVAQLKQQLKKSKVDREELSAELRECRKIKVEPGVSGTEDCEYTNVSYMQQYFS